MLVDFQFFGTIFSAILLKKFILRNWLNSFNFEVLLFSNFTSEFVEEMMMMMMMMLVLVNNKQSSPHLIILFLPSCLPSSLNNNKYKCSTKLPDKIYLQKLYILKSFPFFIILQSCLSSYLIFSIFW